MGSKSANWCPGCGSKPADEPHVCAGNIWRDPDGGQVPPPDHDAANPSHYADKAIEPIEYIMRNKLGFCEGNVVKYVTRWRDKGGKDDLVKARQYLDFLLVYEA